MAGSYIGTLGGAENASFGDTLTFNTTAAIGAGEHPVMIVASGQPVASITIGSLGLTLDHDAGGEEIWSAHDSTGRASGQLVTVTFAAESTGHTVIGELLAGVADSSWVRDEVVGSSGFGSTRSTGTSDGTPLADDIAVAWHRVQTDNTTEVSSIDSGYTLASGENAGTDWGTAGGGSTGGVRAAYKVLSSGGATSATFTLSAGTDSVAGLVVFKSGTVAAEKQSFFVSRRRSVGR